MLPFFLVVNIDLLSVGLAIAGIGVLGFSVLFNNRQSITNINFFLFCLITIAWSVVNYFAYRVANPETSFWLFRLVTFVATWHAFLFFQTFFVFPKAYIKFPVWYKTLLIPLAALISLLTLTPLIFSGIGAISADGKIARINNGQLIPLFAATIIFFVVGGIILLIGNMIKSDKESKKRYVFIFVGVLITFALIMIFNFILPAFFDNPQFIPFGGLFIFPFVAFTAYDILKHKLFNIRVAGVSLLVFALSIVSFFEVMQTQDVLLLFYRGSVFFFTLIFGIVLIKSVLKEVKLREEIERLAKDVQRSLEVEKKANEELAQLDKIKDQFLAQTQHDLRTPLTSIMGYTDLLQKGAFGKQSKKTMEVIKKLQILADGMIKKANNFLDLAQFQLGKSAIALKPGVAVFAMLEEIKNELEFKAQTKGIYLHLDKPEKEFFIRADREKLKAALFNIVDNSIKYTPRGGVTIKLQNHDSIKIIILDTGIGIAPDKIGGIFETMFDRSEQAKKTATGIGVGLYLSTQIIRAHGGRVWAESQGEGKGSEFYVELPLSLKYENQPVVH